MAANRTSTLTKLDGYPQQIHSSTNGNCKFKESEKWLSK